MGVPHIIYALPLAGYMTLIAVLFARIMPRARKTGVTSAGAPRSWHFTDGKSVHARLEVLDEAAFALRLADNTILRPDRAHLSQGDRKYIDSRIGHPNLQQLSSRFFWLALISLIITWTYMFQYFALSFFEWASASVVRARLAKSPVSALRLLLRPKAEVRATEFFLWLRDVSLVEEAWSWVSAGPARWALSAQLCLFAVVGFAPLVLTSTFLKTSDALSSLVIGQIVAISVATGLTLRLPHRPATEVSLLIWPGLIGAALLVLPLPQVAGTSLFLPVLGGLHALLFLPLLPFYIVPRGKAKLSHLFTVLTLLAIVGHFDALAALQTGKGSFDRFNLITGKASPPSFTWQACKDTVPRIVDAFFAHPAQASIGSDALLCALIFLCFVASEHDRNGWLIAAHLFLLMPIVGLGAACGTHMAFRERRIMREMRTLGTL